MEVTFNQPVGNAAKLLGSCTLVDKTDFSPQEVSSVELSEDMKTATLTVTTLSDDTNFVLRFNNFTDAAEELVDLDDAELTTDFPDVEPIIQSSQVEILL